MKVPLLNIIGCYCVELSDLFMYCGSWFCLGLYPHGVYEDSAKAQRYEMAVLCGTDNRRRNKSDLWLVSPAYTSNWAGCPVCGMWSACRPWGWEWRQVAKSSAWAGVCPGKGGGALAPVAPQQHWGVRWGLQHGFALGSSQHFTRPSSTVCAENTVCSWTTRCSLWVFICMIVMPSVYCSLLKE